MEGNRFSLIANMVCLVLVLVLCALSFRPALSREVDLVKDFEENSLQTYIVHVSLPAATDTAQSVNKESWLNSILSKTTTAGFSWVSRIIHSYEHVLNGFAAELTPSELKEIQKLDGFISARPERMFTPQTTHTPDFLGLHQNFGVWPGSNYGKGMIIGVLDSGFTPGHPSFNDEGMPSPPAKWKGKCELNSTACNNKVIGARNFVTKERGETPVDGDGHGTHTASTAAGNFVQNANVFGNANGTAAGMAPLAHLAIYKVCDKGKCAESSLLAGIDAAIQDGVDVISLSLGDNETVPFFADASAVGSFVATQRGIFVSCSAGNLGPSHSTLRNEAPWVLTVGASTTDRVIKATVLLGNNDQFDGESVFQPKDFPTTLLPLVYPGMNGDKNASFCAPGSLNNMDVRDKVVLCDKGGDVGRVVKGKTVKDAGGAAMIMMNQEPDGFSTLADPHVLPATHVNFDAGQKIKVYIKSTSTPTATILFKGTTIGAVDAPIVASFSSRGPSVSTPGILKPDIIGPGVNILAAWPFSVENNTHTRSTFKMITGTSMSCPHLTGIAAIVKSVHPDWSPAAIKSAIMTTADIFSLTNFQNPHSILDEQLHQADVFAIGAGHVNPSRATDPGFVYDIQADDYIPFLCGLGYSDKEIEVIIQRSIKCSMIKSIPQAQLNYPSFAIHLGSTNLTYTRTVTNVGEANSSYSLIIYEIPGVEIIVTPPRLNFTEVNQKLTYQITFAPYPATSNNATYVEGALVWISEKLFVRSPISVKLV